MAGFAFADGSFVSSRPLLMTAWTYRLALSDVKFGFEVVMGPTFGHFNDNCLVTLSPANLRFKSQVKGQTASATGC